MEAEEKEPPRLILNRVKPEMVRRGEMLTTEDVLDVLAIDLIGVVPEDDGVITASNQGLPVALNPRSKAGKAFREIALRLMGEEIPLEALQSPNGFIRRISRLVRQGGR